MAPDTNTNVFFGTTAELVTFLQRELAEARTFIQTLRNNIAMARGLHYQDDGGDTVPHIISMLEETLDLPIPAAPGPSGAKGE